jgi:hypothetical protein
MNNTVFIEFLLSKGLCLKVLFTDKENKHNFVYLLNSNLINKLDLHDEKLNENDIIDICLDKKFSFKNKTPYSIEYISPPDNFDTLKIEDLDLFNDEEYLIKITCEILDIKVLFNNYLSSYKIDFKNINKNLDKDQVILSTFPYHENYFNNFKEFKNKIIKKYFSLYVNDKNQNDDHLDFKMLNSFIFLGINIKNKNITDSIFINALRNKWNSIIKEYKIKLYDGLNSKDFLCDISDDEKQEFLEELALFKLELDKDDMEILNEFKTIKEIISYWPTILTPIPFFVYDEY